MLVCSDNRDKLDIEILDLLNDDGETRARCFVHLAIQGFTGSIEAIFRARDLSLFCTSVSGFAAHNGHMMQVSDVTGNCCSLKIAPLDNELIALTIEIGSEHHQYINAPATRLAGAFVIVPDRMAITAERFQHLVSRLDV